MCVFKTRTWHRALQPRAREGLSLSAFWSEISEDYISTFAANYISSPSLDGLNSSFPLSGINSSFPLPGLNSGSRLPRLNSSSSLPGLNSNSVHPGLNSSPSLPGLH